MLTKAKLLAGTALIVGAIALVAYEEHDATIKYQGQCYENSTAVAGAVPKQNQPSPQECQDPKKYMPWWYVLIAWPDAITTWAIIATCGVIGWQSWETRRSVLIGLRPRLKVQGIKFGIPAADTVNLPHKDRPRWRICFLIENAGGIEARVVESNVTMSEEAAFIQNLVRVMPHFPPYDDRRDALGEFRLAGGEAMERSMEFSKAMSLMLDFRQVGNDTGIPVEFMSYFFGFLRYRDKLGVIRKTQFAFHYNASADRFFKVDLPDWNYAD